VLVELSMVEQRYDAVKEVLDGASVTDVATRCGVDRRTLHRWLVHYANEGLAALADRSSRPDRCPRHMAPEIEARRRRAERIPPWLGSPHDLEKAPPRSRRSALPICDLSLSRASSPHSTQASQTTTRRLRALGAVALDGAVATGCPGQRPPERRDPGLGRHRHRRTSWSTPQG
jgi:transposase-like protein